MSSLSYEIVDVFTDRPFTGNPLAVVFGADELATSQMQALAREFHLSETIFVLPPSDSAATYRARIFTPGAELPFAGHPSVGAAATLVRTGAARPGRLVQECGAGLLAVEATAERATFGGGTPHAGAELDPGPLLEMAGLGREDHAGTPARLAGCGLSFAYLPVHPDAVPRAAVLPGRPVPVAPGAGMVAGLSVFAWDPERRIARARVFAPEVGVLEDPATGSAALGLGAWLIASGLLPGEGTSTYTVRQGAELHRPSVLDCTVTASGGTATAVTVGGHVVPVASGTIAVPPFVG